MDSHRLLVFHHGSRLRQRIHSVGSPRVTKRAKWNQSRFVSSSFAYRRCKRKTLAVVSLRKQSLKCTFSTNSLMWSLYGTLTWVREGKGKPSTFPHSDVRRWTRQESDIALYQCLVNTLRPRVAGSLFCCCLEWLSSISLVGICKERQAPEILFFKVVCERHMYVTICDVRWNLWTSFQNFNEA